MARDGAGVDVCFGGLGADDQAPESMGPHSMVSGSSVAPTGRSLEDDRGVDVAPAGRGGDVEGAVAVEPDCTQPRLPAPGSNAQAFSKTGEAARSHVPMARASGIAPRQARLGERGVGQARKRTARVRTHGLAHVRSAACAPASRAQRQG